MEEHKLLKLPKINIFFPNTSHENKKEVTIYSFNTEVNIELSVEQYFH